MGDISGTSTKFSHGAGGRRVSKERRGLETASLASTYPGQSSVMETLILIVQMKKPRHHEAVRPPQGCIKVPGLG